MSNNLLNKLRDNVQSDYLSKRFYEDISRNKRSVSSIPNTTTATNKQKTNNSPKKPKSILRNSGAYNTPNIQKNYDNDDNLKHKDEKFGNSNNNNNGQTCIFF